MVQQTFEKGVTIVQEYFKIRITIV